MSEDVLEPADPPPPEWLVVPQERNRLQAEIDEYRDMLAESVLSKRPPHPPYPYGDGFRSDSERDDYPWVMLPPED